MRKAEKKNRQELVTLSYSLRAKLTNVLGLSTDCHDCSRCINRHGAGMTKAELIAKVKAGFTVCICSICFAIKYMIHQPSVRVAYHRNSEVLKAGDLSNLECNAIALEMVSALQKNETHKIRLEAFGDISNVSQAFNYLRICSGVYSFKGNYKIQIALWTKNPDILLKAWDLLTDKERANIRKVLSVVLSSVFVNIPISDKVVSKVETALGMPVKVFTVEIEESEHTNCGARCCDKCGLCYNAYNGVRHIFEVVK